MAEITYRKIERPAGYTPAVEVMYNNKRIGTIHHRADKGYWEGNVSASITLMDKSKEKLIERLIKLHEGFTRLLVKEEDNPMMNLQTMSNIRLLNLYHTLTKSRHPNNNEIIQVQEEIFMRMDEGRKEK